MMTIIYASILFIIAALIGLGVNFMWMLIDWKTIEKIDEIVNGSFVDCCDEEAIKFARKMKLEGKAWSAFIK